MMNLQQRIHILSELGRYMRANSNEWIQIKQEASEQNNWFIPAFIELATSNIIEQFLDHEKLAAWLRKYEVPDTPNKIKRVGLVMAGNIPLVGFHDFLCIFIAGHRQLIKPSSQDNVLIRHLAEKMTALEPAIADFIAFSDLLKNCDSYIATGSNNSARYFEYYFGKYPHIIRKNRSSVAILEGDEKQVELDKLADDIQTYFGRGCRNVTKLYVPKGYDFVPLLEALRKYEFFMDAHKYKHNFDYYLAIQIMNNRYYMTNGSIVLTEHPSVFSPISQLHYEYYQNKEGVADSLPAGEIQCVLGRGYTPFGKAQSPGLTEYADGVDTLKFLLSL